MQVRLEEPAIKIVNAFDKCQKIKGLSNTRLVNALIEDYDRVNRELQSFRERPQKP